MNTRISRRMILAAAGALALPRAARAAAVPRSFDHVQLACNDLDKGIAFVESRTGVKAASGGVHPGRASRNALLKLGSCPGSQSGRTRALQDRFAALARMGGARRRPRPAHPCARRCAHRDEANLPWIAKAARWQVAAVEGAQPEGQPWRAAALFHRMERGFRAPGVGLTGGMRADLFRGERFRPRIAPRNLPDPAARGRAGRARVAAASQGGDQGSERNARDLG